MGNVTLPKIAIYDLNFFYAKRKILNNINASISNNKVTALIGPSGSGKSTLLRVFNRIYSLYPEQKAEGRVLLDGVDILQANTNLDKLRSKVGMVFQKPTPFPMSIFENIAFGVRLHEKLSKKQMIERVEWALAEAALLEEVKHKWHEPASGLSGGQQQRLCLARTIAIKPEVILFDEPTSALDPISTQKIEALILKLKKDFTILLVTHNMQQAQRVSDHTIFLSGGNIIEEGATSSFFEKPQNPETLSYILGHTH